MHPILCKIGPFTIYSYGFMLVVGFALSFALLRSQIKRENINSSFPLGVDLIFNFAFIVFIFGVIGARILYIIENLGYYLREPLEIIMLQRGGLSWFGGLLFGFVSGIIYLKKKKLAVYKTLDLIVPFVALGQAIGRLGCLLNGCCFGKVSKFGIYFSLYDAILIPAQIYSSLSLILIFIILRFLQDRPHKEGAIFFTYLLLYSTKRFFIEFWRGDNPPVLWGLTLFQIFSGLIFFLSLIKFLLMKREG